MSRRSERVSDLLRTAVAEIILREVSDPRVALTTVTRVEAGADLGVARVRLSVLGDEAAREASLTALRGASKFIRRQLGRRLRLRATPELIFELDRGAEHSQHISDLLEELKP